MSEAKKRIPIPMLTVPPRPDAAEGPAVRSPVEDGDVPGRTSRRTGDRERRTP